MTFLNAMFSEKNNSNLPYNFSKIKYDYNIGMHYIIK